MCFSSSKPKAQASENEILSAQMANDKYAMAGKLNPSRQALISDATENISPQLQRIANADYSQASSGAGQDSMRAWLGSGNVGSLGSNSGAILGEAKTNASTMAQNRIKTGTMDAVNLLNTGAARTADSVSNLGQMNTSNMINKLQAQQKVDQQLNASMMQLGGAIVGKGNAMKKQYQHDSELWNKHNGTDVGNTVLSDLGLSKKPEGLSWSNFFRSGGNL